MANGVDEEVPHRPWRGWHIVGRFLPMVVLGLIFVFIGISALAPRHGIESYGIIFIWVGAVLIIAAILGMLFTKCPLDYQTQWVACVQEPDVVHDRRVGKFHRELSFPEDER